MHNQTIKSLKNGHISFSCKINGIFLTIVLHGETKDVTGGINLILQDIADLKIINVSWGHAQTQNCNIKLHNAIYYSFRRKYISKQSMKFFVFMMIYKP